MLRIIQATNWKLMDRESGLHVRIVVHEQTEKSVTTYHKFVTHLEQQTAKINPDTGVMKYGEPSFVSGHYDMTMGDAFRDFLTRAETEL